MKKTLSITAGLALLATSGLAAATPTFTNASFETYSEGGDSAAFPDLVQNVSLAGWTAGNSLSRLDLFTGSGYNAADGNAALRVHPDLDQAYQEVTGFEIGAHYRLWFDMAATGVWRAATSVASGYWANVADADQGVNVFLDGTLLASAVVGGGFDTSATFGDSPFDYTTYSLDFTAADSAITFRFDIIDSTAAGGVALDNLRLEKLPATSVPEPATGLLMGLGLLGLFGLRRTTG